MHISKKFVAMLVVSLPVAAFAAGSQDPTAVVLNHCLNDAANASTAGQTDCEATATQAYDHRMNAAYATLMRKLPPNVAADLRASQRTWLTFRDQEAKARGALYETRQGTMYVPMQADDATNFIRDRALQLESYVAVMAIDQ
ncbi:uncharacterized protein YecT (DUF1311 family) [Rhodanobacter sp. K2T2]|uniref:lysozyme inhibitor LprI family protein n=1 Tax=Rhodanobacter sp. K2T2 TaxID=2723085 RepID=UPI0015CEAE8A|nr:lysozyme inhibitor LprI family protein [Rhodanobacter sp. K2T2]NYE30318.1 uncharacterized protein YecT (DUF1311 family) [Rhodanobacter sp. K2T2]